MLKREKEERPLFRGTGESPRSWHKVQYRMRKNVALDYRGIAIPLGFHPDQTYILFWLANLHHISYLSLNWNWSQQGEKIAEWESILSFFRGIVFQIFNIFSVSIKYVSVSASLFQYVCIEPSHHVLRQCRAQIDVWSPAHNYS